MSINSSNTTASVATTSWNTKGCSIFEAAYDAAASLNLDDRPQDLVKVRRIGRIVEVSLPWRPKFIVRLPKGRYASAYRTVWLAVRKALG